MNIYYDPPDDMPRHEWEKGFKEKLPGDFEIYMRHKHEDEPKFGEVTNFAAICNMVGLEILIHVEDWKRLGQPMTTAILKIETPKEVK